VNRRTFVSVEKHAADDRQRRAGGLRIPLAVEALRLRARRSRGDDEGRGERRQRGKTSCDWSGEVIRHRTLLSGS
jgi:hypothetical protein